MLIEPTRRQLRRFADQSHQVHRVRPGGNVLGGGGDFAARADFTGLAVAAEGLAAFGIANTQFLAPSTLLSIISISVPLMVVSTAMTMCLICAEVDLSVVGVVGLSSTLPSNWLRRGRSW